MPLKLSRRGGSGHWQITGAVAGKRVRVSAGTDDRRLADEKRAALEANLFRESIYGARAVVTWDQAVRSYIDVTAPSPSTLVYLIRLTRHFGPNRRLLTINQVALDEAVAAICRPGVMGATKLRAVVTPVRAVLTHSSRRGWCDAPAFETPIGAGGNSRTRWLTPEEYARLRDAAATHIRPLIVFLVCTGARISEALSLDWKDVKLDHARVTLRDVKGKHGQRRDRVVTLTPAVRAALSSATYPRRRNGQLVRDADRRIVFAQDRTGPVFRTDDGLPYRTFEQDEADWGGQIRAAWSTACRLAGFAGGWHTGEAGYRWWTPADVTPHVLRHTWASWHYAIHGDLLRLRDEGLWSTVTLVERYAKVVPETLVPAIRRAWGIKAADTKPAHPSTRRRVAN